MPSWVSCPISAITPLGLYVHALRAQAGVLIQWSTIDEVLSVHFYAFFAFMAFIAFMAFLGAAGAAAFIAFFAMMKRWERSKECNCWSRWTYWARIDNNADFAEGESVTYKGCTTRHIPPPWPAKLQNSTPCAWRALNKYCRTAIRLQGPMEPAWQRLERMRDTVWYDGHAGPVN